MTIQNTKRTLGVCYYPEHWPKDTWIEDAQRMADAGLTWVRIGEFAWSRLEPVPGTLEFEWLDEAIDILQRAGLQVVLGTPTATPPRWMVEKHPDMLAHDALGHPRKFGSRRHYCFSHNGYRDECSRIVQIIAERYGANKAIHAWQVDNEYGCHDTTLSYSPAARQAFQKWLAERYGTIDDLNKSWGNVFWSMEYSSFEQVDLPNGMVTEPNPSHSFAFQKFSSDQVVSFNRLQTDIIRQHSEAPILHNFMGRETRFDHFDVGKDLDIATWDSYPLGFLDDRIKAPNGHKQRYLRQGDPDFQAFHHDLYRAVGRGRWWIIEQQPGPVNWADYNPAPLPGMVELWTWEAFAHGAEAVCYFRWRQSPFAQEQAHSGLLRPNNKEAAALKEVRSVAAALEETPTISIAKSDVALVFDYRSDFGWRIQPHAKHLNYFDLVFDHYKALRSLGLSVDIVSADADNISDYKLVLIPGLLSPSKSLTEALNNFDGIVLAGPRTAVRTDEFQMPEHTMPALPGLETVDVLYAESLPPEINIPLKDGGTLGGYFELFEGDYETVIETADSKPAVIRVGKYFIAAGWLDTSALKDVLLNICTEVELEIELMPEGVRRRDTDHERFWFNYNAEPVSVGTHTIPSAGVVREKL